MGLKPVAILAAAILVAGCTTPKPVQDLVDTITNLPGTGFQLVSLSVTKETVGEPMESIVFQYYSPSNMTVKTVWKVSAFGTWKTDLTVSSIDVNLVLPPLSVSLTPDTEGALLAEVDTLAATLTTSRPGTMVNYWLSSIGGAPTWTVTLHDVANTTFTRSFVDRASGAVSGISTTPPTLGVPAVNRPDFNSTGAREWADLRAGLWASDAVAFSIAGVESSTALFPDVAVGRLPFGLTFQQEAVPVLPDIQPGDGKASVWGFQYYSPSRNKVLPVYVYAAALAVAAAEQEPAYGSSTYLGFDIPPSGLISSEQAAALMKSPYREEPKAYSFEDTPPGDRPHWNIEWGGGHLVQVVATQDDHAACDSPDICW